MRYKSRLVDDFKKYGYNPIHLFGDFYLLRNYPKPTRKFSFYVLVKIKKDGETDA